MAGRQLNFDCGDVVIAGEQWTAADPSGPPRHVVFLHGGGQTRHSWGATAEKLAARGWTCTTLDLRGHGDSSWSRSADYGLPAHAADLRRVIGELGEGAVLVGASMGGLTALTALAENPELARALVLVDIVPRTSLAGVKRIRAFMTGHLGGFGSLMEASEAVAAYTGRKRRPNPEGMRKNVRLSEDGRWYWHWDPAMMTRADRESGAPDPEHLLRLAAKIKVPVLIVGGRSRTSSTLRESKNFRTHSKRAPSSRWRMPGIWSPGMTTTVSPMQWGRSWTSLKTRHNRGPEPPSVPDAQTACYGPCRNRRSSCVCCAVQGFDGGALTNGPEQLTTDERMAGLPERACHSFVPRVSRCA
ncbi:alpha/beta fold hydrolase [Arthrobacter sp. MMS18-M83]|uniref:alpha/beta fold hydrolase n=1 Tax=Arthrobacter sp. MMS18-M83 TaxID=2996261 RepID=UPI00227B6F83|nr:alpha/beta hydrolase [Arthrobacter sp. MMS18-M83]WAH97703.1 alpha/beta hydrolase [Arthrobacter sp. MMS18-M83]